jgi:hypothetical protein
MGKLNELKVRKAKHTEISNRFAAVENLTDSEGINRMLKPQLKRV